ncbi:MAG: diaminopimelate decarboxylase [Deltaproteobacteria bacterium]|nr:diaminopimelate decarboxylase [Deltaproteobacteria bacterium]
MHDFVYKGKSLYCEDVPVERIAAEVGTPLYLYSRATLERHFSVFDGAFSAVPHLTCYSVKACSNIAILRLFARLGAGVDVVSGGEIFRALKAGVPPAKIVYSGVGKKRAEIEYALQCDILQFNVESAQELELISQVAEALGKKARIALRINPDVDPKTHPYISTGLKKNKFGIKIEAALDEYTKAAGLPGIQVTGIACHIGSQITEVSPFVDALKRVKAFVQALSARGIAIAYLDIGGGLGITYNEETPPHPSEYAGAVISELQGMNCTLILEPGRVIVGNAGALVARVLYTKKSDAKNFIVVDAAMNDLVRPSLYDAFHEIRPVQITGAPGIAADIVGPICESGDFLARSRQIPDLARGELIAVMSAGAYGFSMSSNYNSRPRAAEVLVSGDSFSVIRQRETCEDMVRLESIPDYLT